jgi:branched-chain amino acid transport system ATP-binding protein
LERKYPPITAKGGISITVDKAEIVTLIGGNGLGKSTMKSIGITRRARDVPWKMKPGGLQARLSGVVQVPESSVSWRAWLVENLEMGAYSVKDKKKVAQNIEKVYTMFPRLKERRSQTGGTLSGGEQQMLATGRALMSDPRVLLMDEPSMGLAPVLVDAIFEKIVELNEAGVTVLLVEQNARMALQIAHRGYVIQTGEIILSGSAEMLRNDESVQKAYLGIE